METTLAIIVTAFEATFGGFVFYLWILEWLSHNVHMMHPLPRTANAHRPRGLDLIPTASVFQVPRLELSSQDLCHHVQTTW